MPTDSRRDKLRGGRLKKLREHCGLSQQGLAQILGVTSQTIYNYERGKGWGKIDDVFNLCEVLGINLNALSNIDSSVEFEESNTSERNIQNDGISSIQKIQNLLGTNDAEMPQE
jgi:transcriptional regulator with XRE-family HTH domain